MEQHVITKPVRGDGIVGVVVFVGVPVLRQLLRAEHQDVFVAVFVVFDDRQGGEGFAEANAVRQNAAVVFFQLVNQPQGSVPLEVIEQIPDFALLETGGLIGENVLGDIFQKFVEDVIEGEEIDELRRIFVVDMINRGYSGMILKKTRKERFSSLSLSFFAYKAKKSLNFL